MRLQVTCFLAFSGDEATLSEGLSVRRFVGPSIRAPIGASYVPCTRVYELVLNARERQYL